MNIRKLSLCLPFVALSLSASPLNLNTGTANWTVTQTTGASNDGAALNTTTNAVVLTGQLPFAANMPGFESFAWANPFGGAVWIGQLATDGQFSNGGSVTCSAPCGATAGDYIYTLSFDGGIGGTFALSGFTGDNGIRSLTVTASNGTLYSCTAGGPGTLCAGTQSTTASTGTLSYGGGGTVTISARVQNLDGPGRNPSGFILAGSGIANDTPEPSTYAMLGLGGLAMLVARVRK